MLIDIEKLISSNKHLKEGQIAAFYQTTDDSISTYIDIIHYGFLRSSVQQIEPEFRKIFYNLELNDQLKLCKLDRTYSLTAITIENIMFNGIPDHYEISSDNQQMAKDIISAINITNNTLEKIPPDDELLYRYFVNAQIKPEEAERFTGLEFQALLTARLLNEQRVLFTSIVNNLIIMIENNSLTPAAHQQFFRDLFIRENYIQGEQKNLFRLATSECPTLLDSITSIRLLTDPFSKQTNFSTWLNHVQKYLFIVELATELAQKTTNLPQNIEKLINHHTHFSEIYKHDRFIWDR